LAIEEIRYDFTEHEEHFRDFFYKVFKLIIILKLNCQQSNETSVKFFDDIIKDIENCTTHEVKYGKKMIFIKFMQHEFTYHTIKVLIKIVNKNLIDIRIESIIKDFLKFFDKISSDNNTINWNIDNQNSDKIVNENNAHEQEKMKSENKNKNTIEKKYVKNIFHLLDLFIGALFYLSTVISKNKKDSLIGKILEIKNVSVIRKSLQIEMVIDQKIIIINLSSKIKNPVSIDIDDDDNTGKTIKEIILQKNGIF